MVKNTWTRTVSPWCLSVLMGALAVMPAHAATRMVDKTVRFQHINWVAAGQPLHLASSQLVKVATTNTGAVLYAKRWEQRPGGGGSGASSVLPLTSATLFMRTPSGAYQPLFWQRSTKPSAQKPLPH